MFRRDSCLLLAILAFCASACSGGDPAAAQRNQVFYAFEARGADQQNEFEQPYPPLHLEAVGTAPSYFGVYLLNAKVRLSRPTNWIVRSASNEPGRRFIQYISPNEYVFSVFERQELPNAPWRDVIARYEKEVSTARAELVQHGVPIATWNGQGRAYQVRRRVPAAKGPFIGLTHEYLIRADNRVVLVQIVHPERGLQPVSVELQRVMETLELL